MIRPKRVLWLLLLLGGLTIAAPAVSHAQEPAPAEEGEGGGGSSGDPLYGYLGTAVLVSGAIFILCKSARRN